MTSELVLLITLALASYRLWRILGKDSITEPIRAHLDRSARENTRWAVWMADLIECPWCLGFWIAGAVVANLWPWDTLAELAVAWLAVSCLVGLIGARLDD